MDLDSRRSPLKLAATLRPLSDSSLQVAHRLPKLFFLHSFPFLSLLDLSVMYELTKIKKDDDTDSDIDDGMIQDVRPSHDGKGCKP